jgi:hypothetical protein
MGGECRFIRLVKIGNNHRGDDLLWITAWEIFRSPIESTTHSSDAPSHDGTQADLAIPPAKLSIGSCDVPMTLAISYDICAKPHTSPPIANWSSAFFIFPLVRPDSNGLPVNISICRDGID